MFVAPWVYRPGAVELSLSAWVGSPVEAAAAAEEVVVAQEQRSPGAGKGRSAAAVALPCCLQ